MKIIGAIIGKQLKDTLKNKTVLIQFVMFPVMTIIMSTAVKLDGMPHNFFVNLFATMFIGMAPLSSMASILSEEKEKNTLRVLMMSRVSPLQYLVGVGGYIWVMCMLGGLVFLFAGGYTGGTGARFMGIMAAGVLCSILIGAAIGTGCRNQMAATSITVPVMMVFSFLPMLAMFNDAIKSVARLTYSQQINLMIGQLEEGSVTAENLCVILINFVLALALFCFLYRKKGL